MHHKTTIMTTFALTGFVAAGAASASILPSDDTFINFNPPDGAGASADLLSKTPSSGNDTNGNFTFYPVLGFDLTGQPDAVTGATLSLTYTATSAGSFQYTMWGIPDGGADENFDESTLTDANFAYWTSTYNFLDESGLTNVGAFTVTGPAGAVAFSSAAFTTFLNADTNDRAAFVLFRDTINANYVKFASKEELNATLRPTLTIVPEPATLALLGLGGLALVSRRRR